MASFLDKDRAIITAMVLEETPENCIARIKEAISLGAEALGIQLCFLKPEHRNAEDIKRIFASCEGRPIYVTSYRGRCSEGKSDEECAELLKLAVKCGATLADVMGDQFCFDSTGITYDETAVQKQIKLIKELHALGGEVLMSTHYLEDISDEEIMKVAEAQSSRGADVLKIVMVDGGTHRLPGLIGLIPKIKEKTGKKVLLLASGDSGHHLRRIDFGNFATLCAPSYGEFDTKLQPLVADAVTVRDIIAKGYGE